MGDGYDEARELRERAQDLQHRLTAAQVVIDAQNSELEEARRDLAKLREGPPRPFVVLSMKLDPDLPPQTLELRHPNGRVDRFTLTIDGPRLQTQLVVGEEPSNDN